MSRPFIWGADPALMGNHPELAGLANIAAAQQPRTAFARLVVANLGNPARLLAAVKAHKPSKAQTTAANRRKLQALTRGVLPPSKTRNTATATTNRL